jgi:hypothetical protein
VPYEFEMACGLEMNVASLIRDSTTGGSGILNTSDIVCAGCRC